MTTLGPVPAAEISRGLRLTDPWLAWFNQLYAFVTGLLAPGITVTIITAKLTGGGSNGSMTFVNGILTAQTPAT